MKKVKIWFLFFAFLLSGNGLIAQITQVSMGVNGLTCSQCSRSVYNALTKLEFIENVEMDLNETIAHITFKPQAKPDFDAMATAVVKAGYKVRDVIVNIDMKGFQINPDKSICMLDQCFYLDKNIAISLENIQIELLNKTYNADKKKQQKAVIMEEDINKMNGQSKYQVGLLLDPSTK